MTTGTMRVSPVVVWWRATDLPLFDPEYAASLARSLNIKGVATTSVGSLSTSETAAPAPSTGIAQSTSQPSSVPVQGLSPGEKAGVSLGTIFGVIFAALGFFFLYTRMYRKGAKTKDEKSQPGTVEKGGEVAEMEDQDQQHALRKWFFGGVWRSEADASPKPVEMDAGTYNHAVAPPVELDGRSVAQQ